jgi:hypothetical protein
MDKKSEMVKVAEVFDIYEFRKTAESIRRLSNDLYKNHKKVNFDKTFEQLQETLKEEFISRGTDPSFRRKLGSDMISLIKAAGKKNHVLVKKQVADFEPSMRRIMNSYMVIGDIGESLTKNTQITNKQKYYGACFTYLLMVEGVFRELAEYILMLDDIRTGRVRKFSEIETLSIHDLAKEIESKSDISILSKGYSNNLRNAIAHAHFRFNNATGKMTFKDVYHGKEKLVGDFTLDEFGEYYLKIDDLYTLISSFWMLGWLVNVYHDC